jgi:hypothetical protein
MIKLDIKLHASRMQVAEHGKAKASYVTMKLIFPTNDSTFLDNCMTHLCNWYWCGMTII